MPLNHPKTTFPPPISHTSGQWKYCLLQNPVLGTKKFGDHCYRLKEWFGRIEQISLIQPLTRPEPILQSLEDLCLSFPMVSH